MRATSSLSRTVTESYEGRVCLLQIVCLHRAGCRLEEGRGPTNYILWYCWVCLWCRLFTAGSDRKVRFLKSDLKADVSVTVSNIPVDLLCAYILKLFAVTSILRHMDLASIGGILHYRDYWFIAAPLAGAKARTLVWWTAEVVFSCMVCLVHVTRPSYFECQHWFKLSVYTVTSTTQTSTAGTSMVRLIFVSL